MTTRTAFSLGETLAIVLILGACAAFIAPRFAGASEDERTSRAQITIGGIRDAINIYADRARERGAEPFPSINELTTPGIVTMGPLPANPYTGVRGVQPVSRSQAESRAVLNSSDAGWNYFYDNSGTKPDLIFYANCHTPTPVPDSARENPGTILTANEL